MTDLILTKVWYNWVFGQNDHGSRSDFFQKYKYKKRIMIRIVFPRSTKKGFYLLWLSFSIHNLSPDHAKNDPDHAKNDPKLPNLSKLSKCCRTDTKLCSMVQMVSLVTWTVLRHRFREETSCSSRWTGLDEGLWSRASSWGQGLV